MAGQIPRSVGYKNGFMPLRSCSSFSTHCHILDSQDRHLSFFHSSLSTLVLFWTIRSGLFSWSLFLSSPPFPSGRFTAVKYTTTTTMEGAFENDSSFESIDWERFITFPSDDCIAEGGTTPPSFAGDAETATATAAPPAPLLPQCFTVGDVTVGFYPTVPPLPTGCEHLVDILAALLPLPELPLGPAIPAPQLGLLLSPPPPMISSASDDSFPSSPPTPPTQQASAKRRRVGGTHATSARSTRARGGSTTSARPASQWTGGTALPGLPTTGCFSGFAEVETPLHAPSAARVVHQRGEYIQGRSLGRNGFNAQKSAERREARERERREREAQGSLGKRKRREEGEE